MRDPEKGFYYHIWDEDLQFHPQAFLGGGQRLGGGGDGPRDPRLPDTMLREKEMIAGYVRELLDACFRYQRPDALFHDILDDPTSFVETNMAQMLSYTIYRGVKAGWLDRAYLPQADRIREAVYGKVDEFGLVQGVCGAPHFNSSGTATEGQAFFLLMEAAYGDMK
jgi:rhamnogalacturonyl hydrolase YesR